MIMKCKDKVKRYFKIDEAGDWVCMSCGKAACAGHQFSSYAKAFMKDHVCEDKKE